MSLCKPPPGFPPRLARKAPGLRLGVEGAALSSEARGWAWLPHRRVARWEGVSRQAGDLERTSRSRNSDTQGQLWGEAGAQVWALLHVQKHAIANALPNDNFQLCHLFHRHL